jgi:hypothetical protein
MRRRHYRGKKRENANPVHGIRADDRTASFLETILLQPRTPNSFIQLSTTMDLLGIFRSVETGGVGHLKRFLLTNNLE